MAMDSSAIEMRSPAVNSMSSSRRSGFADTCFARSSSSSVVSPIADTTTTTSWPSRRVRMTRSATCFSLATSATEEPPYFWTTMDMAPSLSLTLLECSDHRRVIAVPHVFLHRTPGRAPGQLRARDDVIEPPADIALPHVPPRRPPGEQPVVLGIERAAEIDVSMVDDPLDDRPLLRQLADRARLPFLRMHVALAARDVHVAEHHERVSALRGRRRVGIHRGEELHLGRKILAAVRHVHRRNGDLAERRRQIDRDDAVLVIEGGMREGWPIRCEGLAHPERDAGVALAAVPVTPVALHLAESRWNLIGGGLDFLQADDVRTLLRDPLLHLRQPRPDAVDVPGGELQNLACAA